MHATWPLRPPRTRARSKPLLLDPQEARLLLRTPGSHASDPSRRRTMAGSTEIHDTTGSEQSVAELVKQLSDQTSRLARQEVALAKAELQLKGKRMGMGAGMFGGAGVFGFYALGALTAAAILGLATAVAGWLAAVIV